MVIRFRFLALAVLSIGIPLFAEPPQVGSGAYACSSDGGSSCYSDTNAVNQPLDTETRALSLPNRLVESDMNMFMNPGQIMNYGTAYLEGWLGANAVWGGATVPLPANQKLAVFIRRPLNTNSPLGSVQSLFNKYSQAAFLTNGTAGYDGSFSGTNLGIIDTTAKGFGNADLMYGIATGNLNWGARLSYANMRNDVTNNTVATSVNAQYKMSAHNIGVGAGVQWKNLGAGYLDLSLSSDIPIVNIQYDATAPAGSENLSVKSAALPSISFLTRYVMPVGSDKLLVALNVDQYKVPFEIRGTNLGGVKKSEDAATSVFNVQLDAAYHQNFQEGKLKVIYSSGMGRTSANYTSVDKNNPAVLDSSYESAHFFIPVGVAVEHRTFETVKTRFGIRKNIFSSRSSVDKDVTQKTETSRAFYLDDELAMAMGLGWTPAEKVNVDLAMNAYGFSGTNFFTAISARYHY